MKDEYKNQMGGLAAAAMGQAAYHGVGMNQCAEARQSAKSMLHDRIRQLRNEADRLEALAGALPEKLPLQADLGLWDLLLKA